MFDVIMGVVVGARPIQQGGVSQSSDSSGRVKQVESRKLGTLARGAQSEQPRKERQSGVVEVSTVACDGSCIATLERRGGSDEDIDERHGEFRKNKSGGRSAVDWSWFRCPFHSD